MSIAGWIVLVGVIGAIALEAVASPRGTIARSGAPDRTLRRLALVASLLLLLSSGLALLTATHPAWACVGSTLVLVGGALRAASMRSLGEQFRTEAGATRLVTDGIHHHLRHPSELGVLAWTLGLWLAAPSGLALGLALAQLPLLALRLRIEDTALERCFGDDWRGYAARTSALGLRPTTSRPPS